VTALAREHGVPVHQLGRVGAAGGAVEIGLGGQTVRLDAARLRSVYFEAIPSRMAQAVAVEE
jgi:hypothetical protein